MSAETRLSPGELHSVVFQRAALGRRGYDEDQVRHFLQYVERELVQIFNEKAALAEEVSRLRTKVADPAGGLPATDAHFAAVRILSQAQQTADLYVADAERYTRELGHEARMHREAILTDAKNRAERLMEEAHRKAAAIADSAVRQAEEAKAAAVARVGETAVTPHVQGHGQGEVLPEDERRQMEREIAYLRTYSDVYRTHLRSYLEALLRNVNEWENSEQASLRNAPQPPAPGLP
ncbi:DivIVA domain-containing protein [Actinomadura vinacea]|uniref:DivIVA domain-containing protein n=1 Tax=Actinomadura vinacea TaxID=115336 RepID=UPI0031D4D0E3